MMSSTDQDLIDQYIKGTLSDEERAALERRMSTDADFEKHAREHITFMTVLKQYGDREALKETLDRYHFELEKADFQKNQSITLSSSKTKRLWQTFAVAASVSLISILGTLLTTQSLEKSHTADYKELRKNVEQIKKSQKVMMADIKEVKEKSEPLPGNYEGTGFLFSPDGYVATSYHVIRDADSVYLENKRFGRLKATIVKADQKNDIAILKINDPSFRTSVPFTVHGNEASLGENVFTLGYPREDIVYGEGTISAATGYGHNEHAYQIAVPVNPGNSGGPLLNNQGQLVGIISGLQTETQGAAFAIKSVVLLDVLSGGGVDSLALPIVLGKHNTLKALSRIEQIKKLQDVVFIVRVYNSK